MSERFDVAVIGGGFAGSILARVLAKGGRRVLLLERSRHPRFALGESSTPLAALALERLAARYGLADLAALAAHGRWTEELPELRRGLKRGFTFFAHTPGEPYANGPENDRRLLVAASPSDALADSHWLRADVDQHLALRAARAGVDYRDRVEITRAEPSAAGVRLAGTREGHPFEARADFAVDASGRSGVLTARGGERKPTRPPVVLLFGHFEGVRPFAEVAAEAGATLEPGPYPDDRAAVHHVTPEGWMYVLPFDHPVASAGFLAPDEASAGADDPEAAWRRVLARFPSIERQFDGARAVRPLERWRRVQFRRAVACGERWLALPASYTFSDPLFSTGIAWSLIGVERVASLFDQAAGGVPGAAALERYGRLLAEEADHVERLIAAAYPVLGDFERLVPVTFIYFAAASWAESLARLAPEKREWCWEGFLGARDPVILAALDVVARCQAESCSARDLSRRVARAIEPRNVAGFADPARRNLYPADLELLVQGAAKLGLSADTVRAALPRLVRGELAVA